MIRPFTTRLSLVLALVAGAAGTAAAGQFEFLAAPQTDLNRIYRIDRVTGEIGACQYGQKEGTFGVNLCFPAGDGAGLWLYSRSLLGRSDFGVNRARVMDWLGAFEDRLRRG